MNPTTPDWVKDAIFYQIFPDRFAQSSRLQKQPLETWDSAPTHHGYKGGDLLGVIENLDHLQELGINAIYFCPIFQSGSNHRYHTHDYHTVDPMLGGNDAFDELLKAAHARGMRVILDGVFNHASRGFFQFHDILENETASPYLNWFHVHGFPTHAYTGGHPNYAAWWDYPALPKFNTNTQAVREFLWGVAEHWVKRGIDGWRLDVPNEINDDAFWQEFRRRVKTANPEAYIVGEIWDDATRWLQGDQFDAVMNYLFTRTTLEYCGWNSTRKDVIAETGLKALDALNAEQYAEALQKLVSMYPQEVTYAQMNLLGSHDTPRILTVLGNDVKATKLAVLMQMTFVGAPCVYYGDEIGLEGGRDPDCRRGMPWDQNQWDKNFFEYTRRCIEMRTALAAMRRGTFQVLHAHNRCLAFARELENQKIIVAINADHINQDLQLSQEHDGQYREYFSGLKINIENGLIKNLLPQSAVVLVNQ